MKLFQEFSPQTYEQWKSSVEKELKGLSFEDTLIQKDEVEELEFQKFENQRIDSDTSQLNYTRAARSKSNDWWIGKLIEVKDERLANKQALEALNQGASSLRFVLQKKTIAWSSLFENIGLSFISVQFQTLDEEQTNELRKEYVRFSNQALVILNDPLAKGKTISSLDTNLAGQVQFDVNAVGIHQAGANATDEIAFALSLGHDYIVRLLKNGFSIDDASAMVRFTFGIGSNYFLEATKFRVFRKLWANVIAAYEPTGICSHACYIYAQTGFVNKSLKDPYTNLLRQTTEAMSAVLGGANEIYVLPYDHFAQEKEANLSERMALNISNLLKEESYFDKVIDPLGGSYNIEKLTQTMENKAWSIFQQLEKIGGILTEQGKQDFHSKVKITAQKRIEQVKKGEKMLIGINKYPNPDQQENQWLEMDSYFGLDALILEKQTV